MAPYYGDNYDATGEGGGGFSLGGFLKDAITFQPRLAKNLLEDVGDAALGFFPGIYHAATTNPIDTIKQVAAVEWQQWSPLFTGHPIKFAEQTFDHPLGPLLDVAAFFTGGASLAGKGARLASSAEYTTKAAGALGTRTIARPAATAGAFQARIAEPSIIDRLAATTRTPPEIMRFDRPGAPGRLASLGRDLEGTRMAGQGDIARMPIPKSTSRNAFTQQLQVGMSKLSQTLATKGGKYQLPAQMSYEQAQLVRLAGNASALEWQYGQLARFTEAMNKAETNPQLRANMLRDFFEGNWENLKRHADKDGMLVPLADWENGTVNKLSYRMLAQKKYVHKKRPTTGKAVYGGTDEQILDSFKNFGKYISTPNVKRADIEMVNGIPHVRLVNRQTARNMGIEAKNSASAVMKAYYKGTNLWKGILLGLSPRFLVNNAVGNAALLGAETMGSHAAVGMFEATKQIKGVAWAEKELTQAVKETGWSPTRDNHWINRWHSDQMGQSFHSTAFREDVGAIDKYLGEQQQRGRVLDKATSKGFDVVGKYTERNLRIAALYSKATSEPLVKEAIKRNKKKGMRDVEAVDKAIEEVYRKHPEIQRRVTDEVYATMGNYVALHGVERKIRAVDPFYTWQRHIVQNTARMAFKHPGRTLVATHIGHQGSSWVQEALGEDMPDWMRTMLPGEGLHIPGMPGRTPVISTSGLNPWASAADIGLAAESVLPGIGPDKPRAGETVGTQLNPFVQSGIEALTGTSMLTGQPLSTKDKTAFDRFQRSLGPIGQAITGPVENLPQAKIAGSFVDPPQYAPGSEPMFSNTPEEALLAWLGLPIKWLNQDRALQLGRAENTSRQGG